MDGTGLKISLKIAFSVAFCMRGATTDRVTTSRCLDATAQRAKSKSGVCFSRFDGISSQGLYLESNLNSR